MDELPKKKVKRERRIEDRTILILKEGDRVGIRKRPSKGLLAGLYELPGLEGHLSEEEVLAQVKAWGYAPLRILPLTGAKHIFSHVEWHMRGFAVELQEKPAGDYRHCSERKTSGSEELPPSSASGVLLYPKIRLRNHLSHIEYTGDKQKYLQRLLGKIQYVLQINPEDGEFCEWKRWITNSFFIHD